MSRFKSFDKMSSKAFLLVLLQTLMFVQIRAEQYAPVVSTDYGPVRGSVIELVTGQTVLRYVGIPFAKADRFKPPSPPTEWKDTKDAFTFGKMCPQHPKYVAGNYEKMISEDCLNLNVFIPANATAPSTGFPVMVWIHGGAFLTGSNRLYDGSFIATLGEVVVVVINYRLGIFGFLATGKEEGALTGNYGMLDQIEALKWVKSNIKKFGGNPGKVTIFGESAGGASVSLLNLSPLASGLFINVICESGSAAAVWASSHYSDAQKIARLFGKFVGCGEELSTLKRCVEGKNITSIVNAAEKIQVPTTLVKPVIDGKFLPDSPVNLLKTGKFDKKNVLLGMLNDDGSVFVQGNLSQGITRSDFVVRVNDMFGTSPKDSKTFIAAIMYRYTDWAKKDDPIRIRRMTLDMMTDSMFAAPATLEANALIKRNCTTYFFSFEYRRDIDLFGKPVPSWKRAYHGSEIDFVFGTPLMNPNNTWSADANFTRSVIKLWSNFAKHGDPNLPSNHFLTWPKYGAPLHKYISMKPGPATGENRRADYIAFWNEFVPYTHGSEPATCAPTSRGVAAKRVGLPLAFFTGILAVLCFKFD